MKRKKKKKKRDLGFDAFFLGLGHLLTERGGGLSNDKGMGRVDEISLEKAKPERLVLGGKLDRALRKTSERSDLLSLLCWIT